MKCPFCGAEMEDSARFCGSCGNQTAAGPKGFCEVCMGAFDVAQLESVEGRKICPVCLAREERRKSGIPDPGLGRVIVPIQPGWPKGTATSMLAVLSLVSVFFCWTLFGIPSILLGVVSLLRIKHSGGTLEGAGLSIAAIALGVLTLVSMAFLGIVGYVQGKSVMDQHKAIRAAARIGLIKEAQSAFVAAEGYPADEATLIERGGVPASVFEDPDYRIEISYARTLFTVTGVPKGGRGIFFLLDENGILRSESGRPAAPTSPPWKPLPVRIQPVSSGSG